MTCSSDVLQKLGKIITVSLTVRDEWRRIELPLVQHDAVEKKLLQANLILFQNYILGLVRGMSRDRIDLLVEEIKKEMLALACCPHYVHISVASY